MPFARWPSHGCSQHNIICLVCPYHRQPILFKRAYTIHERKHTCTRRHNEKQQQQQTEIESASGWFLAAYLCDGIKENQKRSQNTISHKYDAKKMTLDCRFQFICERNENTQKRTHTRTHARIR